MHPQRAVGALVLCPCSFLDSHLNIPNTLLKDSRLTGAVLQDDIFNIEFLKEPGSTFEYAPLPALNIDFHQKNIFPQGIVKRDAVHRQILILT